MSVYHKRLKDTHRKFLEGKTQGEIREEYGEAQGQKLYLICCLNCMFPTVRFIERILSDSIKYAKICGRQLPNLRLRADPIRLAQNNYKERQKALMRPSYMEQSMTPSTAEDLEDAICYWMAPKD